ncbi:MAG: amino acid ABC transporter substrate-binding protein [Candidimonas sp.]|nr:MAG: amino acid ABC transporter substrate-binding protein [Candidimonas sp.]TAM25138.1 MAG: amino acid ABC transporter substrate-binding protein [Candidimonas sp.]
MKLSTLALALMVGVAAGPNAMAESSGTLQKIKDTHEIVLGYREDAMPFSYISGYEKPIGYSLDICREIVGKLKTKLGMSDLKVSYQPVTASNRIPLLVNGSIDIECGSTTNTKDRQKTVAFLYTTYVTGTKILVRVDSGIKDLGGLKGKKIAVTAGTNNIKAVQKVNEEKHLNFNLVYGDNHALNFLQLENKRVDGFSTDAILLSVLRAGAKRPKGFTLVGPFLSVEPYALMVRKNDPAFKNFADSVLDDIFKNGDFTKIYDKWFLQPVPPKNLTLDIPMPEEMKQLMLHPSDTGS